MIERKATEVVTVANAYSMRLFKLGLPTGCGLDTVRTFSEVIQGLRKVIEEVRGRRLFTFPIMAMYIRTIMSFLSVPFRY